MTTSPNTQSGEDELSKDIEAFLPRNYCAASCDGHGTYAEDDGSGNPEPAQCQWCYEVVIPLREKLTKFIHQRESSLLDEVEKRAPKNRTSSAPDYDWDRGAKVGFNAANREWRKALQALRKELLGE